VREEFRIAPVIRRSFKPYAKTTPGTSPVIKIGRGVNPEREGKGRLGRENRVIGFTFRCRVKANRPRCPWIPSGESAQGGVPSESTTHCAIGRSALGVTSKDVSRPESGPWMEVSRCEFDCSASWGVMVPTNPCALSP